MDEFTYELPDPKIARYPLPERDSSKLLIYRKGEITESVFSELSHFIPGGSLLIFNNTEVIHARLIFHKATGAPVEIFCLSPHSPAEYQLSFSQTQTCTWKCLVGNLKKWKHEPLSLTTEIGNKKIMLTAEKTETGGNIQFIRFSWNGDIPFGVLLDQLGSMPIPPYLKRDSEEIDKTRYQTIYSRAKGSVAAPTAGLHFTETVMESLRNNGVKTEELTLHVGAGTFQQVKSPNAMDHTMHVEFFSISKDTIDILARQEGYIISTGTTTLRTLESLYWLGVKSLEMGELQSNLAQWEYRNRESKVSAHEVFSALRDLMESQEQDQFHGQTQLMIVPGYNFRVAHALITNYHQPGSTLLLLVAAFVGEDWRKVYSYSLENNFRFLSYGDSSLLWRA
jgi:S-adenosylmethionine:tRNA ribosyltransferase-isomerase